MIVTVFPITTQLIVRDWSVPNIDRENNETVMHDIWNNVFC